MQERHLLKQILEATRAIWDRPGTRPSVRKQFAAVLDCGTPALGWRTYASDSEQKRCYFRCKSRFCASCGYRATLQWLEEQEAALPDTQYSGIVFTMPSELWPIFRRNLRSRIGAFGMLPTTELSSSPRTQSTRLGFELGALWIGLCVSSRHTYPRTNTTATLLSSGQVLVVGGQDNNAYSLTPAELYDPTSGTCSIAGDLNTARTSHAAALLNDGTVLISGGIDQYQYQGTTVTDYVPQAEIYQTAGQPVAPDSLQITPASANVVIGSTQSFTGGGQQWIPAPGRDVGSKQS